MNTFLRKKSLRPLDNHLVPASYFIEVGVRRGENTWQRYILAEL